MSATKTITITGVRPPAGYRHYTNESSQGSLIRTTRKWPQGCCEHFQSGFYLYDDNEYPRRHREPEDYECQIPRDSDIGSIYVDRVWHNPEWKGFAAALDGRGKQQMGLNELFENATESSLLKAASILFGAEVSAVRVVYYYNVATGYDCQRIDAIYDARTTKPS